MEDPLYMVKLKAFEENTSIIYSSHSASERAQAQAQLDEILPIPRLEDGVESENLGPRCHKLLQDLFYILNNTTNPYASMYSSQALVKILKDYFALFRYDDKTGIKIAITSILWDRVDAPIFFKNQLYLAYAVIMKKAYFQDRFFNFVKDDIARFLQGAQNYKQTGIDLLYNLVEHVSGHLIKEKPSDYSPILERKILNDFKENYIMDFLNIGLEELFYIANRIDQNDLDKGGVDSYLESILNLLTSIFSFDFVGSNQSEDSEDAGSSQFPASWKPIILNENLITSLITIYKNSTVPVSNMALTALTPIVSCRRSLFTEIESKNFSNRVMRSFLDFLINGFQLDLQPNHHALSRAIFRFRYVHSLSDLTDTDNYFQFISALFGFTITSIERLEMYPNSIPYLLNTWIKITSTSWNLIPTNISEADFHTLPTQIFSTFLNVAMSTVERQVKNSSSYDDLLGSPEILIETLGFLSIIGRYRYTISKSIILDIYHDVLTKYEAEITTATFDLSTREDVVSILEGKLAWLIYTIGSLLKERVSYRSLDEDDIVDAELSSLVFMTLELNHSLLTRKTYQISSSQSHYLGKAFLFFFDQFQSHYIGDSSYRTIVVYKTLEEKANLKDSLQVLNCFVHRIRLNLTEIWQDPDQLIPDSIQLLLKLTNAYNPSKQLRQLQLITEMIQYHGPNYYPFMTNLKNLKFRGQFYNALVKVVLTSEDISGACTMFKKNLEESLDIHASSIAANALNLTDSEIFSITGLAKDLEGIFTGLATKNAFQEFYFWFFYKYQKIFSDAVKLLVQDPREEAHIAIKFIMKLINELVLNRSQRLSFPNYLSEGIRLFKEIGLILCLISEAIKSWIEQKLPLKEKKRLSIIKLWFIIFNRMVSGGYICFGAMKLYNDPVLNEVLKAYFGLIISLPLKEINDYPKLQLVYYELLEQVIVHPVINSIEIPPEALGLIHRALMSGIDMVDIPIISSGACRALDHIITVLFQIKSGSIPATLSPDMNITHSSLVQYYNNGKGKLGYIFESLLSAVIFGNVTNLWSYSRPMFAIINWDSELFELSTSKFIKAQIPAASEVMRRGFSTLIEDLEMNLSSSSRDTFTQRLTRFVKTIKEDQLPLIPIMSDPLLMLSDLSL